MDCHGFIEPTILKNFYPLFDYFIVHFETGEPSKLELEKVIEDLIEAKK
jgi:hypothetical protein